MSEFADAPAPCRLGYEEHDGTSYCFAHGGFALTFIRQRTCDRVLACPLCEFNAKRFEPRVDMQRGALRYHMALHESGRVHLSDTDARDA